MNHPGNTMFRNLIHCNLEVYSNLQTRTESTAWTWGFVRKLKRENGARFLKEERIGTDTTVWIEVSNEMARNKVRIAFRDAKKRRIKYAEKQKSAQAIMCRQYPKHKPIIRSDGILDSNHVPETSISSKRKISEPNVTVHEQQSHSVPVVTLNSNQFDVLNNNISELNNNPNALVQVHSARTSSFLGLDGTNGSLDGSGGSYSNSKRQRFNCFG